MTGTWYYDTVIPQRVSIYRIPAKYSSCRLAEYGELTGEYDENIPIPDTDDGFLYYTSPFYSGEHRSVEAVKVWVDLQPWAPVTWDD